MEVVLDDIGADAVKTGMLHDAAVIETVASVLAERAPATPLVLDPVMVATSGDRLLAPEAVVALRTKLIPRAALITPNLPEAAALLGVDQGTAPERNCAKAGTDALRVAKGMNKFITECKRPRTSLTDNALRALARIYTSVAKRPLH